MMCGDSQEHTVISDESFYLLMDGVFTAGRHSVELDRELTKEEMITYSKGFIPATVQYELDGSDG